MTVITMCSGRFAKCGIALSALTVMISSAAADPIVNFNISVLGGTGGPYNNSFAQAGLVTGTPGVFNVNQANSPFPTGITDPTFGEWSISVWDFNVDNDPTGSGGATGARIGAVFTVTNNRPEGPSASDNHLFFSIYINMNVYAAGQPTSFFGNGGMTLTAPDGSGSFNQITAVNGPIWNYLINGSDVASLYAAGYNLGLGGPGTNSTSANLDGTQTGPLAGMVPSSIGIRLDFDLTPGETVTFNGAFGLVPAPGALALLGLAGLTGRSRRRA